LAPACTHTALTTVGRITYDDLRVAHVVSPVSGRVEQVLAKPGDALLARGVLATLRSPDFATARADWHKAQVALEAAKRDLARQDGLFARHAAPEQVVLAAWDTYRRAVSEHDRARANLELLGGADVQGGTDVYQLRTPIAGVVVSRSLHAGMEVAGQYGGGAARELFLVADLSRVWVVAEVPEADLGRIGPHAEVVVHVDAVPDMPLTGTLDYIADTLDPALHTARVRCAVPNATGKLKPDMYATLTISAQGNKALAVPPKSIAVMADISFVFVEKPSQPGSRQFERRHVVVDAGDDDPLVSILHGVREGERVVTDGAQMLKALIEANP
jgi:cobalt-zinc-cadmium efflux system membrane fusion protein